MPAQRTSSNNFYYIVVFIFLILVCLAVLIYFTNVRDQGKNNDNIDNVERRDNSAKERIIYKEVAKPCPKQECPVCQCHDPSSSVGPGTEDGQVTMQTSFGRALYDLSKKSDVNLFLEIGTWYGGGSTLCIAKGLQESGKHKLLYTIEMYEPAWAYARKKFGSYPIRFILGGTVPKSGYLRTDEIPPEEKNEHYRLYYERDLALADTNEPWLEALCRNHKFDAVLIDGNEYTGWAEYQVVNEVCRPKYLALHDVGTLKTRKIEEELAKGPSVSGWEKIAGGADKAVWRIYKRSLPYN